MATRKKSTEVIDPNAPILKEIMSEGRNSGGTYYNSVDGLSILRLLHTVTTLGGMVTFWRDSNNLRLCFSVRLWNQPLSYNVNDASDFPAISEDIVGKLSKYLADKKLPPPPPLEPLHLLPKPKK